MTDQDQKIRCSRCEAEQRNKANRENTVQSKRESEVASLERRHAQIISSVDLKHQPDATPSGDVSLQCRGAMVPSGSDTSVSDDADAGSSAGPHRETFHRLKVEVEIHAEDLQQTGPRRPVRFLPRSTPPPARASLTTASMVSLVRWNLGKVLEKDPNIDLKGALQACHSKLATEPRTGRLCAAPAQPDGEPASPPLPVDRHLNCALLAWQAQGETDLDRLVEFATTIKQEDESVEISMTTPQHVYSGRVVDAFCCPNTSGAGYIGHRPVGMVCPPPAPVSARCADKQFYEGLTGPVVRLPDHCGCQPREFAPVCPTSDNEECCKLEDLDVPGCLEGGCMERLRALDEAAAALRERASRLAKRDADRAELLERAELAWADMERGYKEQMKQAVDKEDDIARRIKKLVADRNRYKCGCGGKGDQLQEFTRTVEAERRQLAAATADADAAAVERARLTSEAAQCEYDLHEAQCRLTQLDRDSKFIEEKERRKATSLAGQLEAERALTHEADRAMRLDLSTLRDQFAVISDQLLEMDDNNKDIKEAITQLKETKASMVEELENCKHGCDDKMSGISKQLADKKEELAKLKDAVVECSCKRPVEICCQVTRTPSLAAMCRCSSEVERSANDSCSCTSLRTRMMSDLLRDLFTGLQQEMVDGSDEMSCELLKCLADDHQWDKNVLMKQKLKAYFKKYLANELDIAIVSAIEYYHARWVGQSCVDAEHAAEAERAALVGATPCVCSPGAEAAGPAAQAWQRTQADVYQLSVQLQQLKQESIRRADFKSIEDNLTKIVENIAKPKAHMYVSAETETPMLQASDDVCIEAFDNVQVNSTPFTYPKPGGQSKGKRCSTITKKFSNRPKNLTPSSKVDLCKSSKGTSDLKRITGDQTEHEKKQDQSYLPSMTSVDICIHSSQRTGSPRRLSQYSRLLNSVSLDGDGATQPECSCTSPRAETVAHASTYPNTDQSLKNIFMSRGLNNQLSSKILQGCACTSECNCFNKVPAEIDIDELMRQMLECCKLSTGLVNKDNLETIFDVEKKTSKTHITDGKNQKDTYNELIIECMRSYTANKNIFLGLSEQTLSKPSEKESSMEGTVCNAAHFLDNNKIVNIMTATDMNRCGCSKDSKPSMSGKKKKNVSESGKLSKSQSKSTNKGSGEPVLAVSYPDEAKSCSKCKCRDGPKKSKVFFKSEDPSTKPSEFINTVNLDRSSEGIILCRCPKPEANEENNFVGMIGKYINHVKSKICTYKKSITTMFGPEKGKCRCEDELGPYLKKLREESKMLKKQLPQNSKSTSEVMDKGTAKMETCPGSGTCMDLVRSSKSSSKCLSSSRSHGSLTLNKHGSIASSRNGSIGSSKYNSKYHKFCTVEMPPKHPMSSKERKEQQDKYTIKSKKKNKSVKPSKHNKNEQQNSTSFSESSREKKSKSPNKNCDCDKKDHIADNTIKEEKTMSRSNDLCICEHCQSIITQKPNNLVKGTCHCKQSKCMYCDKMKNNNGSHENTTFPTVKSKSEVTPCCCEYNLKFLGATLTATESNAKVGNQFLDGQGPNSDSEGPPGGLVQDIGSLNGKVLMPEGDLEHNLSQVGGQQSNEMTGKPEYAQDQTGTRSGSEPIQEQSLQNKVQGAQLQGETVEGAQLHGETVEGAQLQGEIVEGAQLHGETVEGAQLQGETQYTGDQMQGLRQSASKTAQRRSTSTSSGNGNVEGSRKDSKSFLSASASRNIRTSLSRAESKLDKDAKDSDNMKLQENRLCECSPVCGCGLCCMAANKSRAAKTDSNKSNIILRNKSSTNMEVSQFERTESGIRDPGDKGLAFSVGKDCKCSCSVGSATHGPMQTKAIQSTSSPSNEECVCCTAESNNQFRNPVTDELELNAFQLLQKYVHCKMKKMKCSCCPHNENAINEEVKFSNMLDKVKKLIHSDIERLACRCQEQYELENSEIMAFSLLEEYVRSKINDISCSCARPGKSDDTSIRICETTLASIKDVIQNDLADLSCCCKTDKEDCTCVESELPSNQCVCVKPQNNSPVICSCNVSEDNIKRPSHNTKSETKVIEIKSKSNTSVIELESNIRVPCYCQNSKGIELRSESKSEVIGGSALKQEKQGSKKCGCPERLSCAKGENVVQIISESKTSLVKVSSGSGRKEESLKLSTYENSISNDNIKTACCTTIKPSLNTYTSCVSKQPSVKRMLCAKPPRTSVDEARFVEIKTDSRISVINVNMSAVKSIPTRQCTQCKNRKNIPHEENDSRITGMCTSCGRKKDNDVKDKKKSCINVQKDFGDDRHKSNINLSSDLNHNSACVCKPVSNEKTKEKSGSFVSGKKTCDHSERKIELRSEEESSWVPVRDAKSSQRSSVNFSERASIAPYTGYTIECSCDTNMEPCTCSSKSNNTSRQSLHSSQPASSCCCPNTRAFSAPRKCSPQACASKPNTAANKTVQATRSCMSASNITSTSTAPYAGFTMECSCDTNMEPCICSNKSSKLKPVTKKDSCECTMVPICQVKLLVKDIEQKLQSDDCTCEMFSPAVCPIHAKMERTKSRDMSASRPEKEKCSICRRPSTDVNVNPGGGQICNLCNCVDKL